MFSSRITIGRHLKLRLLFLVGILLFCEVGMTRAVRNRWGIPANRMWCQEKARQADSKMQRMATTIYNVPMEGQSNFRARVRLNGTGILRNGQKVTYNNMRPQANTGSGEVCDGSSGSVAGSGGKCLTPFFSVAADPAHYSIGDIICVPGLRGRQVNVPNRGQITHTGCLIVGDKGAAIKGENRFDFFTGTVAAGRQNSFADLQDKNSCHNRFSVVRAGSSEWASKMNEIDAAWNRGTSSGQMIARYRGGAQ